MFTENVDWSLTLEPYVTPKHLFTCTTPIKLDSRHDAVAYRVTLTLHFVVSASSWTVVFSFRVATLQLHVNETQERSKLRQNFRTVRHSWVRRRVG